MLTQRPVLLEDSVKAISRLISRFRRQTESPEQTAIVTARAEAVLGKAVNENDAEMAQKLELIVSDASSRLNARDIEVIDPREQELNILAIVLNQVQELEGSEPSTLQREMDSARSSDAAAGSLAMIASRIDTTLEIFCAHCPYAPATPISGKMTTYADMIWVMMQAAAPHQCADPKGKGKEKEVEGFSPDVWIRRNGGHPWGTGRCWEYVDLGRDVDKKNCTVDIVNTSIMDKAKDYTVLAWNVGSEGDDIVPLPISVPKYSIPPHDCCHRRCQIFKRHLQTVTSPTFQPAFVGRIGSELVDNSVLDKAFDTITFLHRRNDFYVQCA